MPKRVYSHIVREIVIPVGPSIAYVPLNKGLFSLVDTDALELISSYDWTSIGLRRRTYARSVRPTKDLMHRMITECPKNKIVDHINGNTLDNRRVNLRTCTPSENSCNQKMHRNNAIGLKGVSCRGKLWRALIMVNGKQYHLGYHQTPELAYAAYVAASRKYHGEFGRTN